MRFYLAAAGGRGGGKVEILLLDFHFSAALIKDSLFLFALVSVKRPTNQG